MRKVLIYGDFFVVHSGHIRILNFAKSLGDELVIAVTPNKAGSKFPSVSDRVKSLEALKVPNSRVIELDADLQACVRRIRPDVLVKGAEFRDVPNREAVWLAEWGGKIVYASGELSDFIFQAPEDSLRAVLKFEPALDFVLRHGCLSKELVSIIDNFKTLQVLTLGDLIVDEYINCEALGMSQEDPTLVVSPNSRKRFVGGAGIVASHVAELGADSSFFSVSGEDETAEYALQELQKHSVKSEVLVDSTRPTTLKQRYRVEGKTLLRVSHLRQHGISLELEEQIYKNIKIKIKDIDLLIISDFCYGCLPQRLVGRIIRLARKNGVFIAADSQASSQIGELEKYTNVNLVAATEYEARLLIRNNGCGLQYLTNSLIARLKCNSLLLKLGKNGVLVNSKIADKSELFSDQLPALNTHPVDPAGAGDSMLVVSCMAQISGATIYQAAFLGSIAAAIQVSRVGNVPIGRNEIREAIRYIDDYV